MNRRKHWFQSIIGLGLLVLLAGSLALLLRHVPKGGQPKQAKTTTVELVHAPAPTQELLLPTPLPTDTAAPPTPTTPPIPTLISTPVVTPIGLTKPPMIPLPVQDTKPYTIISRDGNVISAIGNDGANQRELVDVDAKIGLGLRTDTDLWGVPSPDGSQIAFVLNNVTDADQHNDVISSKNRLCEIRQRVALS